MTELRTPSGYTVQFKDYLTTGARRAVNKTIAHHLAPVTQETAGDALALPLAATLEAEEVALQQLVLSVELPDGNTAPDPVAAINEMPEADGDAVYAKVNEISSPPSTNDSDEDDPKNGSAASTDSSGT